MFYFSHKQTHTKTHILYCKEIRDMVKCGILSTILSIITSSQKKYTMSIDDSKLYHSFSGTIFSVPIAHGKTNKLCVCVGTVHTHH